jgi:hypothetical protein
MPPSYPLPELLDPYDLALFLTQEAVIARDTGTRDPYGAELDTLYAEIGVVPCRFYPWREEGARSPAREYAVPEHSIFFTGGALICEPNADVKPGDRALAIIPRGSYAAWKEGKVSSIIEPPVHVVAVILFPDHLEADLMRPQ